jgi:NAD(P)-dependent dehydrogenase (short-subunit alcohol dehydrogenase family)
MDSLHRPYRALVVGATGTIGSAFVRALAGRPGCEAVTSLSRLTHAGFDLEDPESIGRAARYAVDEGPFALIIDATGVLATEPAGPEKSLTALQERSFQRIMQINALGPMLLLRALTPAIAEGRSIYGKLSARVGSISDNRLGGWYSYRASKAALNMLLQTAAIELHRRRPQLIMAALQPGTVRSPLSERFLGQRTDLVLPDQAAVGLLDALDALPAGPGASFIDYRGQTIAW